MRRSFRDLAFFGLTLGIIVPFGALAKEADTLPAPPPMALPQNLGTYAGHPLEITLQVGGRVVEPLNFLIRTKPRLGTLGEIRRTGRNTAAVVYTPDAGTLSGDESFTFAAQSFDSPVSAPARIRIRLEEKPAVIEFPHEVDFGMVFLGETSVKNLEIRNSGGGVVSGTAKPVAPWEVFGPAAFRASKKHPAILRLAFSPHEERNFSHHMTLAPQKAVTLLGKGMAPVTWTPAEIKVAHEEREKGEITIEFTNHTPDARMVTIQWPDFVREPHDFTIPPLTTQTVNVRFSLGAKEAFDGAVEVASGRYQSRIFLRVFPSPAKLQISPEEKLHLGELRPEHPLKGRFVVKNTGGTDTPLQIRVPEEITISPDPSLITLAAGKEIAFDIALTASKPYAGEILLGPVSDPKLFLLITASAPVPDLPAPAVEPEPQKAPPVETFLNIPPPGRGAESGTEIFNEKIPSVTDIRSVLSTPHVIEVAWKLPAPDITTFQIERRRILPGEGERVLIKWLPWPEAKIRVQDGEATARFERMPSNGAWTIRVLSRDTTPMPGPPSPNFLITTQPQKPIRIAWWGWLILATLAGALLAEARRRNNLREAALHAERIERIGKH